MKTSRRSPIDLDSHCHRAMRLKAAKDQSLSDLINKAIRRALAEDTEDLAAYRARKKERSLDLETALATLQRHGKR